MSVFLALCDAVDVQRHFIPDDEVKKKRLPIGLIWDVERPDL